MSEQSYGERTRGFKVSGDNPTSDRSGGRRRAAQPPSEQNDDKSPKPKRVAPEGAILPDRGWPKFRYGFNKLFRRADRVPKINAAQRAELNRRADEAHAVQVQGDLDEYEQLLKDAILRTNQARRWSSVIANVKGGASKSPTSAILSIFIGWVTRRQTTAIDNNPFEGTLWKWLGIDRQETVTVRQLNERVHDGMVTEFIDFSAPLGSNAYNVQLVASDRVAKKESYDHDTAKTVIEKTKKNSIFTINDTSNAIGDGTVEAALEASDVLIVPALDKDDKLEGVRTTLDSFSEWGHSQIVKHAIVLVNGMKEGACAEDYRVTLNLEAETTLVGIPFVPSLHIYRAINPDDMTQEGRIASLELTYIVSSVARHVQEKGFDSEPLKFQQGKLVRLSSGRLPALSYVKYDNETIHNSTSEGGASS